MPALQFDFVDPYTGMEYPNAYLVIDDARVHLAAGLAVLFDSIYGTAALYTANKAPILTETDVYLTPAELDTLRNTFVQTLYQILQGRHPGSTIVP